MNVVVFGATSCIAAAVTRRLAERGDRLFLVGRSPEKLAAQVGALGEAVVGSIAGDLDELEANEGRIEAAERALGTIDLAVLAHGLLGDQLATEADLAAARAVLTTNLLSPVSILLPLAQRMEAQRAGALAVITSVAGERGRPRNYTYGAAKGGLSIYLEGLRSRLHDAGVTVTDLKLGPVDTPMTVDHPKNALFATPEQAAAAILRAIDGRKGEAYVPGYWRPIMAGVRSLPEPLFQRFGFLSGR